MSASMNHLLMLVPTELERHGLAGRIPALVCSDGRIKMECCGFGPIAAAAKTAQLLMTVHPDQVLLVGIAGSLDDRIAVGTAHQFGSVACHGVGAGTGTAFVPAAALGWQQWAGGGAAGNAIGDTITLRAAGDAGSGLLLTVCAAAGDTADVVTRKSCFPAAVAEDMEGFGVAMACQMQGIPCTIIRGISNLAGDRERTHWQIDPALRAAAALVNEFLAANP